MRLFFAIKIPSHPDLQTVAKPLRRWASAVRFIEPEQWHLTLRFLGETDPEQLAALQVAATDVASRVKPFALSLTGIGTFSQRGRLSVIWIGVTIPPEMQRLHDDLEQAAVAAGFLPDRRPFRPHLTIGRVKSRPPIQLQRWLVNHENLDCGTVDIESLELIQSKLTPQGSIYTPIHTWALAGV